MTPLGTAPLGGTVCVASAGEFGRAASRYIEDLHPHTVNVSISRESGAPDSWPRATTYILIASTPLAQLSRSVEAMAYASGTMFLPVTMRNRSLIVGPVVIPGRGSCWSCWHRRTMQHARWNADKEMESFYDEHPQMEPSGLLDAHAALAAAQVLRLMHSAGTLDGGALWRYDLITGEIVTSQVIGIHGCPRCGLHREESDRSSKEMLAQMEEFLLERKTSSGKGIEGDANARILPGKASDPKVIA